MAKACFMTGYSRNYKQFRFRRMYWNSTKHFHFSGVSGGGGGI